MESGVQFLKIKDAYRVGHQAEFKFVISASLDMSDSDWVGLYKIKEQDEDETETHTLLTYVWVPVLKGSLKGRNFCSSITFEAGALPTDTESTYCVRYVSSSGVVCGESLPFHMKAPSVGESSFADDLIAVTDGDLLIVKTKAEAMSDELDQWVDSQLAEQLLHQFVVENPQETEAAVDHFSDSDLDEDFIQPSDDVQCFTISPASSTCDVSSDDDDNDDDDEDYDDGGLEQLAMNEVEQLDIKSISNSCDSTGVGESHPVSHVEELSSLDFMCFEHRPSDAQYLATEPHDEVTEAQRGQSPPLAEGLKSGLHEVQADDASISAALPEVPLVPQNNIELHSERATVGSPVNSLHSTDAASMLEQKVRDLEVLLEEERSTVRCLKTQHLHMMVLVDRLHNELKAEIESNSRLRQHLTDKAVTSMYDEPYVPTSSGLGHSGRLPAVREESTSVKDAQSVLPPVDSAQHNCIVSSFSDKYDTPKPQDDFKIFPSSSDPDNLLGEMLVSKHRAAAEEECAGMNGLRVKIVVEDTADTATQEPCLICESSQESEAALTEGKSKFIVDKLKGIPNILKHLKSGVNWLINDEETEETMEAVRLDHRSNKALYRAAAAMKEEFCAETCPICDEVFPPTMTKSAISTHVDRHQGTYCPVCFTRFGLVPDRATSANQSTIDTAEALTQTEE